ncbi:hypothetical protein D3C84_1082200 [compost metagenome]
MKKPSREAAERFLLFVATLGALTSTLVAGSMIAGQAKQDDFNGEKTLHESCVVMDTSMTPNRNGREFNTYKVTTSCGDFVTDFDLFETITENETYDLTATAGNWASKPTIISIEPSLNP